jgi:predicted O-linked N-acetylglucosamine transferase (SPINDLY family)
MGIGLRLLGHLEKSVAACRVALEIDPGLVEARGNLAAALVDQGRLNEGFDQLRIALDSAPDHAALRSQFLFTLNYATGLPPAEIFAEHQRYGAIHEQRYLPECGRYDPVRTSGRRVRVGYLSPDFRTHSVAFFIEPLLARHDRRDFEVFCYSDLAGADRVTERLRALADHWREVHSLSNNDLAAMVREDGVDILVDLAAHTGHRLLAFARKPAPIQVTYLGYPNTTGLSSMDYRITDTWADPPGESDTLHTEQLMRLAHGFLCYQPPADAPPLAPPPMLEQGNVTFGSFNHLPKVNEHVVRSWAAILQSVPGSRLLLKCRSFRCSQTQRLMLDRFLAAGVPPQRLVLLPQTVSQREHLAQYNQVDIALDPFPYNGTTTTCEALWMGVPVIAMAGPTHASRVSASLLTRLALPDLVVATPEAYVDAAVRMARDAQWLQDFRMGARERMLHSSLTDAPLITASLEEAYRTMLRNRRAASRSDVA